MIRLLDILLALIGLIVTLPILIIVVVIGYFDTGSPLFIQERVGKHKKGFKLIKFRTMKLATQSVASHWLIVLPLRHLASFCAKPNWTSCHNSSMCSKAK